jgi:hypothetical protein
MIDPSVPSMPNMPGLQPGGSQQRRRSGWTPSPMFISIVTLALVYVITGFVTYETHWCVARGLTWQIPTDELIPCVERTLSWPAEYGFGASSIFIPVN